MSQSEPLVSIIMPCFNGMPYLDAAINSVKSQSYSNWELMVIDNGSLDKSRECAHFHADSDNRVKLLECAEHGAAAARNLGIERSLGSYIAFLDCDDIWNPDKLKTQVEHMRATRAGFSWTAYQVIDESGKRLREQQVTLSIDYERFMAKESVIGCLTVMFDCDLLGKSYMPALRMRQDYALWAELISKCEEKGIRMVGIRESLAQYRVHPAAMTNNKVKAAYFQWRLYRVARKHSLGLSTRYFTKYLINAFRDRLRAN